MICPNCQLVNEIGNVYCVNCGTTVSERENVSPSLPPTQLFQNAPPPSHSIETAVLPVGQHYQSMPGFTPSSTEHPKAKNKILLWAGVVFTLVLIGVGSLYFLTRNSGGGEILPEHLGMFIQSQNKDKVSEIRKQDFTNALDGADRLLKDDNLTTAEENPNLILYSEGKDVPLNDLRLIRLDTVKSDGSLQQLDFQAVPIENKPEMKRIRIPDGLAKGKYAFAVLDGFLDEGKHKFWAFEVKNSGKSSNDSDLKATTVSVKQNQNTKNSAGTTNIPSQPVPPPPGAAVRYISTTDVIFRSGPGQSYGSRGKLAPGQKVYVIGYSTNYEYFRSKDTGQVLNYNYAEVQTENGKRGWVYAAFLK